MSSKASVTKTSFFTHAVSFSFHQTTANWSGELKRPLEGGGLKPGESSRKSYKQMPKKSSREETRTADTMNMESLPVTYDPSNLLPLLPKLPLQSGNPVESKHQQYFNHCAQQQVSVKVNVAPSASNDFSPSCLDLDSAYGSAASAGYTPPTPINWQPPLLTSQPVMPPLIPNYYCMYPQQVNPPYDNTAAAPSTTTYLPPLLPLAPFPAPVIHVLGNEHENPSMYKYEEPPTPHSQAILPFFPNNNHINQLPN